MSYVVTGSMEIKDGLQIGENSVIYESAHIGKNVRIGRNVSIANAIIGDNATIEDNAIIGYSSLTGFFSQRGTKKSETVQPARIGAGTLVRTHAIVYAGAEIGDNCWIGHEAMIREKTVIGHDTSIGTMSDCEGHLSIGNYCSIHSQVHIGAYSTIKDYVFIAPYTVFTNESPIAYRRPQIQNDFKGPTVEFGVQIGAKVVVLPRINIGHECVIGAASLVTRDIPALSFCLGSPARVLRSITSEERLPLDIREKYKK